MAKSEHINEETIDYLFNHLQTKKDFSSLTVLARRQYQEDLEKQINHFYKNNQLDERNRLVELRRHMVKDLPFDFELSEEVLVKGKRTIKAIIRKMNPHDRQVLVKPIDNLCKEEFYCPESWIFPIKKREEDSQMKLF